MPKAILLILLMMTSAHAEVMVYKWVDEQGNVHFSDTPNPQAEAVELKPQPAYTPAEIPDNNTASEAMDSVPAEALTPNYQLSITAPTQEQAMWANDGKVTVSAQTTPSLSAERGDKLLFNLDGIASSPTTATRFTFKNVYRGAHSVSVSVIDSQGKTLSTSNTVTFYVHRPTINRPAATTP
jgi:predicted phage tail protein